MEMLSRNMATLALLSVIIIGSNFAWAQTGAPSNIPSKKMPNSMEVPDLTQLQRTANEAQSRIQASDSERKMFIALTQSKNIEQIKSILLRNGFTSKQMEGAKIVINDQTGGSTSERFKITIKCCPLIIIIIPH